MKSVGVKEFRNNLKACMQQLPLAITHRGQTVAIVVSSAFFDYLINTDGIKDIQGGRGEVQVGEVGHGQGDAPKGGDSEDGGEGSGVESGPSGDVPA